MKSNSLTGSLRENTVFLRLLTYEEILDDGRYLSLIHSAEDFLDDVFTSFENISLRMRPIEVSSLKESQVGQFVGRGFHQAARFMLFAKQSSLELNAMGHPYSGNHVTLVEWKIPNETLKDKRFVSKFVALFQDWISKTKAIWAYAHDADDNTIQNVSSKMILSRGFGVQVDQLDLAKNPGREYNLAEFRYAANWLTYVGPTMLDRLEATISTTKTLSFQTIMQGRLYQLYEMPHKYDEISARSKQIQLIEELGVKKLTEKEQWRFGYWQRKR